MKQPLRFLINSIALISILACAAATVLWTRSYFYNENLHWFGDGRELSLRSCRGEFDAYRVWAKNLQSTPTQFSFFKGRATAGIDERVTVLKRDAGMSWFGPYFGFALFRNAHPGYADYFAEIMIPWWFLTLLTAILPIVWLRSYRLRRRGQPPGLCRTCGYDLRATPGRCPECGTAPSAKALA